MSVDDAIQAAKGRLESLLAPISGGVGDDISYDESFEAIKAEIDKQNAIEGGATDWTVIVAHSESLLADKSKDFRIALYWGVGSAQGRGLIGVLDGLVLVLELCNAFWEPMYPALKRPRARGNLLGWYAELCAPVVQNAQPTAAERDVVDAVAKVFRELDGYLADKLGEAYPGMPSLRDFITNLVHRAPVPAPPAPPPSAAAPEAPPPSVSGDAGPSYEAPVEQAVEAAPAAGAGFSAADIVDGESAFRALAEVAPLLARAGEVLLALDPLNANGHRLLRQGTWLPVGGDPYHDGGVTQVYPPGEHVTQGLKDLVAGQDWSNLALAAAAAAVEHPFCLDAVRALALAYQNLGADYEPARKAVERETASLLARAPTLPTLKYMDGSAFASAETQTWLAELAGGGGGGGGKTPVDRAIAEAGKMVAAEQPSQAVGLLSRAASAATSPVQRFRARLEIARVALRFQLLDIARAQLEGLERLAEEHRLSAWDPELCAEVYANLYKARRAQAALGTDDPELARKISQTFERLCEIDASRALGVMQELG